MDQVRTDSAASVYARKWEQTVRGESSQYVPEKYQLGIVTEYLARHEISYTTEAKIFCYPIDVLATKRETTIAIELKSRNLGDGIEQARRNTDYVDYSFLSLWDEDVTETTVERVSDLDIGLIGISDVVRVYSAPSNNGQQLCSRNSVIELIEDARSDDPIQ